MAAPSNVELEAAKFLHKLIQESKDEPSKLATKLYVVCNFLFNIFFFELYSLLAWKNVNVLIYYMWNF